MTWPVSAIAHGSYRHYLHEVGGLLKFGHDWKLWTWEQQQQADSIVQRGVLQFYTPPPIRSEKYSHEWSFLRPLATMTLPQGQKTVDLPSDFAMLDGRITFVGETGYSRLHLQVRSHNEVRDRILINETAARPQEAAIVPKTLDATAGTQYQMLVCPTPDKDYAVQFAYRVNPGPLSDAAPYPLGGPPHYETILASCLAVADLTRRVKDGVWQKQFLERLEASVSHDRLLSCPPSVGRQVPDKAGTWSQYALDFRAKYRDLLQ